MSVGYNSSRATRDVDFTTSYSVNDLKNIGDAIRDGLERAARRSGYLDLVCRLQGDPKLSPPGPDRSFQTLELRVASAQRDTAQQNALRDGRAAHVTKLEVSVNEYVHETEEFMIPDDGSFILAYSIEDLIAEKMRALLQQPMRNRDRRQDVYDIAYLVKEVTLSHAQKTAIYQALLKKCAKRGFTPERKSIDNPEVRSRAGKNYHTMGLEIGSEALDFDQDYKMVSELYASLPWGAEVP